MGDYKDLTIKRGFDSQNYYNNKNVKLRKSDVKNTFWSKADK